MDLCVSSNVKTAHLFQCYTELFGLVDYVTLGNVQ